MGHFLNSFYNSSFSRPTDANFQNLKKFNKVLCVEMDEKIYLTFKKSWNTANRKKYSHINWFLLGTAWTTANYQKAFILISSKCGHCVENWQWNLNNNQ